MTRRTVTGCTAIVTTLTVHLDDSVAVLGCLTRISVPVIVGEVLSVEREGVAGSRGLEGVTVLTLPGTARTVLGTCRRRILVIHTAVPAVCKVTVTAKAGTSRRVSVIPSVHPGL